MKLRPNKYILHYIYPCSVVYFRPLQMAYWCSFEPSKKHNIFHPLYTCYHLPLLENDSHPHHKHIQRLLHAKLKFCRQINFCIRIAVVPLLSFTVTWKWFPSTSQIYRDYYIHNFFSIKIAYEKYHLYRNKQSFHKGFTLLHLLYKYTEATICIIFSVSNLHMKNTFYIAISNHFKKRSTCYINIQGGHYTLL